MTQVFVKSGPAQHSEHDPYLVRGPASDAAHVLAMIKFKVMIMSSDQVVASVPGVKLQSRLLKLELYLRSQTGLRHRPG